VRIEAPDRLARSRERREFVGHIPLEVTSAVAGMSRSARRDAPLLDERDRSARQPPPLGLTTLTTNCL
jgi:hypothetical protein